MPMCLRRGSKYKGGIMDNNINFEEIMGIHKKEAYDPDSSNPLERVIAGLSEIEDRPNETYSWRFNYKGKRYTNTISGRRSRPITDENILLLMQGMVKSMEYLINKNKKKK